MTGGGDDTAAQCALIGVDWGTTTMRAYALDAAGAILDAVSAGQGILGLAPGEFGTHLEAMVGAWVAAPGPPPIVLSGMITSRQGWLETAYLECPAPVSALSAALVPGASPCGWPLFFVTGLCCRREDGAPDVMRGEETQILGAGIEDGVVVMPGTHSKWVRVSSGAVEQFTTYMTGELFAALKDHTILGRLMTSQAGHDDDAFERGVTAGLKGGGGLLGQLFSVRARGLTGEVADEAQADYLSGLLLGSELQEARRDPAVDGAPLVLLGRGDLVTRYARAAELAGMATHAGPEHCAARGHYRIARAAGLVP